MFKLVRFTETLGLHVFMDSGSIAGCIHELLVEFKVQGSVHTCQQNIAWRSMESGSSAGIAAVDVETGTDREHEE